MQALRETDPRRIGPYPVLGRLGAGGMGEVYLVESPVGERVAVKVVRAEYAEDRTFRARFRQEVRAARTVGGTGTYVARIVDADTEGERPWMATEFVDGPNLRDAVLDHDGLPVEPVRVLAAALGEALGAIHSHGLVHRDLKPSNILLAQDGPRVIDFGVVRALEATALTRTGSVVGSAGYLSPEQIRTTGQVGPASDVFSLGAVLAYAAAGRDPFGEGRDAAILMRIMARDFDLSGVPDVLRPLIETCLREDPAQRPSPADVVAASGYPPRSLPGRLRPDWFTLAEPVEGAERWLPERGSGEGGSRVEYVAPLTLPDAATAAPWTPSRRRLLQGLAAGAVVATGVGTGGWLFLRDRGAGNNGEVQGRADDSAGAGRSPSKKAPPEPQPPVVDWDTGYLEIAEFGGPCGGLSPDGDLVCFGGLEGKLNAVSRDGAPLWRTDLGEAPLYGGVVGTPVVTAYGAYCVFGQGSQFFSLDLNGRVRWKRAATQETYESLPVLAGDLVVVATGLSRRDKGTILAYRSDGSVAWNARLPDSPWNRPVAADGVVYAGTQQHLTALDAEDGTLLWSADLGSSSPGQPALVGGTVVLPADGSVHGFSLTGKPLWQVDNRDIEQAGLENGTCAALGDLAVITAPDALVAVDPADGSTVWTVRGEGDMEDYSEPTVHEDLVYAFLGRTLYVVDGTGEQQQVVTFADSPLMPKYRPLIGSHPEHGRHVYVATPTGIAALDLTV